MNTINNLSLMQFLILVLEQMQVLSFLFNSKFPYLTIPQQLNFNFCLLLLVEANHNNRISMFQ
jgi:hypothetical protein